jgi:hypothetical protein
MASRGGNALSQFDGEWQPPQIALGVLVGVILSDFYDKLLRLQMTSVPNLPKLLDEAYRFHCCDRQKVANLLLQRL